jgi:hypothetical protein
MSTLETTEQSQDGATVLIESTALLGTKWIPKNGRSGHWKVTDIFGSVNGRTAVQIEKYQGGRNSPAIVTTKRLKKFFRPDVT